MRYRGWEGWVVEKAQIRHPEYCSTAGWHMNLFRKCRFARDSVASGKRNSFNDSTPTRRPHRNLPPARPWSSRTQAQIKLPLSPADLTQVTHTLSIPALPTICRQTPCPDATFQCGGHPPPRKTLVVRQPAVVQGYLPYERS